MQNNIPTDLTELSRKEKREKLEKCFSELKNYSKNKLRLQYPTFFVPGWASRDCAAWKDPYVAKKIDRIYEKYYKEYYRPMRYWADEIIENKNNAYFVTFTEQEDSDSLDFVKLGKFLKNKISLLVKDAPINLVGHSMGGLDIRAAILDDVEPKLNVKNVITVGTPNNGTGEAGLFGINKIKEFIQKIKGFTEYHIAQGRSMFSRGDFITMINNVENRTKLLNRIDSFYVFMGLKDGVVKGSPRLDIRDLSENLIKKVRLTQTSSADHSGKDGLTQDPRVLLPLIQVICGVEIKDNYNHGYILKKTN